MKQKRFKQDVVVSAFVKKLTEDTGLDKNEVTEALLYEMIKFAARSPSYTMTVLVTENNKRIEYERVNGR